MGLSAKIIDFRRPLDTSRAFGPSENVLWSSAKIIFLVVSLIKYIMLERYLCSNN